MKISRVLSLVVFTLAAASSRAQTEQYVLVTSNGTIGSLKVTRAIGEGASSVDNEWRVDDNGRGAKLQEHIELDAKGLPKRWHVKGKAWVGAPVDEMFEVTGGKAKWTSLDDKGEGDGKDALYLANNSTPWALGMYVRALLASPNNTRAVLPGGTLRLEKIKDVDIGTTKERVTAYALWGIGLDPTIVLMNGDRYVGNVLPGWVVVDKKHEAAFASLSALAEDLSGSLVESFTKKVTHTIEGDRPLWITRVRVFDSIAQMLSPPRSVVVFRGKIASVSNDAPPKGALVVDGAGGTLLPGLVDAHAHIWDWAGPYHIAAGVTFGRDPGNDNATLLALTDKIDRGVIVGPRLKMSGFLEGKSPFSANGGFVVSSEAEGLEKVRWYAEHGFWGIKIYNSTNPAFVKAFAAEAHRLGLHVSGHVPAFMSSEQAVKDGYDEIHHINQLLLSFLIDVKKEDTRTPFRFTALGERTAALDLQRADVQALVKMMKRNKVTIDPTMSVFSNLLMSRPGAAAPVDKGWLDHMPVSTQRARKTATLDVKPEQYGTYEKSWAKLEQALVMLHKEGIPLVPGTDDQAGFALHSELETWVKAGIPASAVLSAATIGGARLLGWEQQLGSIEPGKLADLYLVDGDPTKDISAIRKGRLVVKGNAVYYPDEIHAALGVKPFATHVPLPK